MQPWGRSRTLQSPGPEGPWRHVGHSLGHSFGHRRFEGHSRRGHPPGHSCPRLQGKRKHTPLRRVPYQSLHSLNALPSFSEKALFFTDFCCGPSAHLQESPSCPEIPQKSPKKLFWGPKESPENSRKVKKYGLNTPRDGQGYPQIA